MNWPSDHVNHPFKFIYLHFVASYQGLGGGGRHMEKSCLIKLPLDLVSEKGGNVRAQKGHFRWVSVTRENNFEISLQT